MTRDELHSRIQLLLDEEISAEQFAELEAELLRNPEALADYRLYAGLHCGLERAGELRSSIKQTPVVPIDRVMALQRRRVAQISLIAAAALIMLCGIALWMVMTPDAAPTLASFRTAPGSSFSLSQGKDSPGGNTLVPGSSIQLDHGVAELMLPHQVRAILEAPASLKLVDERTVLLNHGKTFFEVPNAEGHGFTVTTPHQRIVDLGTAFGIHLPADSKQTHLHVLEGSVRVDALQGSDPGEVVAAPRAVAIDGTKIEEEPKASSQRFRRYLPDKVERILVDDFESGLLAGRDFAVWMDRTAVRNLDGQRFSGIPQKDPWRLQTSLPPVVTIPVKSYAYDGGHPPFDLPSNHQPSNHAPGLFLDPENTKLTDESPGAAEGWKTGTYAGFQDSSDQADPQITFDLGATQVVDQVSVSSHTGLGGAPDSFRLSTSVDGKAFSAPIVVDHQSTGSPQVKTTLEVSDWAPARFWRLEIVNPTEWLFLGEVTFTTRERPSAMPSPQDPGSRTKPKEGGSPPQLLSLDPSSGENTLLSQGHLAMIFDEPIQFGTGRIFFHDLTEEKRAEIVVGSPPTSIAGTQLRIAPPVSVADGTHATGYPAGWKSDWPVTFHNPSKTEGCYRSEELHDRGQTRGEIGAMRGPTLVSLSARHHAHPLRREIGPIAAEHRYTVSLGMGTRREGNGSRFLGYKVRLISRGTLLAELANSHPPGPANTMNAVGLSWDSSSLPEGVSPGDPLTLEISPLNPKLLGPGYLDLDHLRVSAVTQ